MGLQKMRKKKEIVYFVETADFVREASSAYFPVRLLSYDYCNAPYSCPLSVPPVRDSLTFLEYQMIGVASSLYPDDLLNREGQNR